MSADHLQNDYLDPRHLVVIIIDLERTNSRLMGVVGVVCIAILSQKTQDIEVIFMYLLKSNSTVVLFTLAVPNLLPRGIF